MLAPATAKNSRRFESHVVASGAERFRLVLGNDASMPRSSFPATNAVAPPMPARPRRETFSAMVSHARARGEMVSRRHARGQIKRFIQILVPLQAEQRDAQWCPDTPPGPARSAAAAAVVPSPVGAANVHQVRFADADAFPESLARYFRVSMGRLFQRDNGVRGRLHPGSGVRLPGPADVIQIAVGVAHQFGLQHRRHHSGASIPCRRPAARPRLFEKARRIRRAIAPASRTATCPSSALARRPKDASRRRLPARISAASRPDPPPAPLPARCAA